MKRIKLDRIDLRILSELQRDGRMTNVDLAEKAGISAPPCLRRVRALEEAGFIKSYHAVLAADKLGYGIKVMTMFSLDAHNEEDLQSFIRHASSFPEVREVYAVTGEYDFMLKIVSEDWDSYQNFLRQKLTVYKNIRQVKSFPVVGEHKQEPGVPVPERVAEGDETV